MGHTNLGGGIATGGDLFFIGATMDRQIRAFDVASGETLWQYAAGGRHRHPHDLRLWGKQYVVINAGPPHVRRDVGDYLYAFALPD